MIAEEPSPNGKQKCYFYEEAIEAASVGRFHYFLLVTCGLCYVAVSAEVVGLSIVSYSAQCELQFSLFEKGFLNSVGYLGVVISSHMMGFLADTLGRVQLLKISLLLSICTSMISVFSASTTMLITCRFFTGIFMAGCQSCIFTLLSEYHSDKSRMKHITILASFMVFGLLYTQGMAIAILPLDLSSIPYITPWRLLLMLFLVPSVLALICLTFTPESPKYLLSKGEQIKSINILSKVYAFNTRLPATSYPCELVVIGDYDQSRDDQRSNKVKQMWTQTMMLFDKERITKTLTLCFLAFFPTLIGSGSFMWLPLILNNLITYSSRAYTICDAVVESTSNSTAVNICSKVVETSQYEILMFMSVVYFLLFVINSLIINSVGKKSLLVFWYLVGMGFAISVYWSNFYLLNIIALTFIIQVANWIGIVAGIASEYYPTSINAMGVCFIMMLSRIGAVIGSNIVGPLLTTYCDYMFFMYGGLMLVVVLFTLALPTKGKSK